MDRTARHGPIPPHMLHKMYISLSHDLVDLASDARTHRCASASYQAIWGPYTRAGQSMSSQRQTCASHSTLRAEIVAADLALRKELLAALPMWEIMLDRPVRCLFLEDNQAVCK
eukprot:1013014-Pyramimonas_sp.AAC.1